MAEDEAIQWQPIEFLDLICSMIRDMLDDTREQYQNLKEAKTASLDDYTVGRIKRLFTEREFLIDVDRRQLALWRKEKLSGTQEQKIKEAEVMLNEDEKLVRKLLKKVERLVTIDQILSMSDLEVALRSLSGEFDEREDEDQE